MARSGCRLARPPPRCGAIRTQSATPGHPASACAASTARRALCPACVPGHASGCICPGGPPWRPTAWAWVHSTAARQRTTCASASTRACSSARPVARGACPGAASAVLGSSAGRSCQHWATDSPSRVRLGAWSAESHVALTWPSRSRAAPSWREGRCCYCRAGCGRHCQPERSMGKRKLSSCRSRRSWQSPDDQTRLPKQPAGLNLVTTVGFATGAPEDSTMAGLAVLRCSGAAVRALARSLTAAAHAIRTMAARAATG